MNIFKNVLNWIEKNIISLVPIYCLYIITIIMFYQVISRYFFHYSIRWIEELSRYLTICMVFFGGIFALKSDQLVRIKIIYDMFPKKYQKNITILINLLILVFLIIITYYGFQLSYLNIVRGQLSPALKIPLGLVYIIIPFSGIFMIIFTVYELFKKSSD